MLNLLRKSAARKEVAARLEAQLVARAPARLSGEMPVQPDVARLTRTRRLALGGFRLGCACR